MADNPQVRAGTAGGTITVAADEVTIYGSAAQLQGIKIHDGLESGTIGARVTSAGELVVNQQNSSTVSVSGVPNVHVTNAATVTLTGTNPVTLLNNGTVIQGTNPWIVTANSGTLLGQEGTVAIRGNVLIGNNGTVTLTGTNPVFQTNDGTVIQGTNPWIVTANSGTLLGQDGTVAIRGNVLIGNNGTVSVSSIAAGDNNIGNVDVLTLPGGITGFAEDATHTTGDVGIPAMGVRKNEAAALAGADADYTPLISDSSGALWTHVNDGTVAVKGNVVVGNNGTVSVSSLPGGITGFAEDATHTTGDVGIQALAVRKNVAAALAGADADYTPLITDDVGAAWTHVNDGTVAIKGNVLVGNNGTVSITGTPNVFVTNAATVTATDLDIRDLAFTQDSIKKGSATIGLGYTLGGTNILLTASGTVVPSVSSRVLYVTHEALTVQGGTVTITARNGDGGGTLWGPMQFSPTGGMAASLPIEDGGLYETASGSAVYYVLSGSGTVGGRIRWARLAS